MNLIKLLIEGFEDAACVKDSTGSIKAVINPKTYSRSYSVQYKNSPEFSKNAPTQIFNGIGTGDLQLELVVDGTGIVPLENVKNVDQYITKLKNIVYSFKGDVHRPNFLKVTWGEQMIITGVCTSLVAKYTLFNPDGSALRATVTLSLSENKDYMTKSKEAQKSSPDLTHQRTVKAGDTLPLMAYRIYGDSAYYVEVAKFNKLKSFMDIRPGDQLYFPPIKK